MKLPLPTYRHLANILQLVEAVSMFVEKLDEAIKSLMSEPTVRFHSKGHLIRMVMYTAGLFMCEESYKDVERYLGDDAEVILRDFANE